MDSVAPGDDEQPTLFRVAGISYLQIPAGESRQAADFYASVFGSDVDTARTQPSFRDGTGHVIGHFVRDAPVAGEAGVRPYVYVQHIDDTLATVIDRGGAVVTPPYPEGDL
jgi:predicted enzyme related to lactoylglutathione lyase